jgi:predicted amidohydrolase
MLRVCAVQLRARLHASSRDFAGRMEGIVREACERDARLVVFPEDNGTQLLGILPGFERLAAKANLASGMAAGDITVADLFHLAGPYIKRIFIETFAVLAKTFRVAIVSGGIRCRADDGRLVNVSYCFTPDGRLAGSQEKLHLMRIEEEWGFAPGRGLTVVQADGFGLAFPICHDATFFETFRLALASGADVVAIQSANAGEYNEWHERRGIWPRVQETPVYGVASHLVGPLLGTQFTGRGGIYAPLDLSPNNDGVLARANTSNEEEIVMADLDLKALSAWRECHPPALPREVILRYLPGLYEKGKIRRQSTGNAAAHGHKDQDQEQGHEELAEQEHGQSAPAGEAISTHDADIEEEKAPTSAEQKSDGESLAGEEQSG